MKTFVVVIVLVIMTSLAGAETLRFWEIVDTLVVDSAAVDSILLGPTRSMSDGWHILHLEQLDSLLEDNDLDSLTFWCKTVSRSSTGVNTVQGDSIPVASDVGLDLAPKNSVDLNISNAFLLNADSPLETMQVFYFLYMQNVGGAAADSARIQVWRDGR